MLLHENKTIFWDYIKHTKDRIKLLRKDINIIDVPDFLKQELNNDCDKISAELAAMRMLLIETNAKNIEEWEKHKQIITSLQNKIFQSIKNATLANHAPVKNQQYS